MKRVILIFLFFLCCTAANAQDLIVTYSEDTLKVKVIEIQKNNVKYKLPGEDVTNNISTSDFQFIKLESGRIINGESIHIEGEEDWEKVIFTGDASLVNGLEFVTELSEKSTSPWGALGSLAKEKDKVITEIKHEAAKNYCHIALVIDATMNDSNPFFGKTTNAQYKVKLYRYKGLPIKKYERKPMIVFENGTFTDLNKRQKEDAVSDVEEFVGKSIDNATSLDELTQPKKDYSVLQKCSEEIGNPGYFVDSLMAIGRHMAKMEKKLSKK